MNAQRFLFSLLLLVVTYAAQAQASKKKSQVIKLDEPTVASVYLDVNTQQIEVVNTKSKRIIIETTIQTSVGSVAVIDYLDGIGRYDLVSVVIANNTLKISPFKRASINIKGESLQENLLYKIYLPKGVRFVQKKESKKDIVLASTSKTDNE